MSESPKIRYVWLPTRGIQAAIWEAESAFPCETGGVLSGYFATGDRDIVVTNVVGPGINAVHTNSSFSPDSEHHAREIARYYEKSNHRDVYLGDWHTHPNSSRSLLSGQDRRTLKHIAESPEARNSNPVMMILAGKPSDWCASAWIPRFWPGRRFKFYIRPYPLIIKTFSEF